MHAVSLLRQRLKILIDLSIEWISFNVEMKSPFCSFLLLSTSRNVALTVPNTRCHSLSNIHKSSTAPFDKHYLPFAPSKYCLSAHGLKAAQNAMSIGPEAFASMSLLALQFGVQPSLTRKFTDKSINRSTVIFVQDVVKFCLAGIALFLTGGWDKAIIGWNTQTWLRVAGIPAVLYGIQNYATLIAYQNLSPLTFNVLNQTKTLSAALCCYLLMGKEQSNLQILSLFILFSSACIIEKIIPLDFMKTVVSNHESSMKNESFARGSKLQNDNVTEATALFNGKERDNHIQGVLAVLLASFLSGLAGAFAQKNLQGASGSLAGGRNSYFFTMELCAVSLFFTGLSMMQSEDGARIRKNGFFDGWTSKTIIPIITNATGGIVVGLVTKYAGTVKKGFALIFGLLISGLLQAIGEENGDKRRSKISKEHIVGGILAAFSLWMHSAYPAPNSSM
jgi:UDP-sugar transporter A1/2/3